MKYNDACYFRLLDCTCCVLLFHQYLHSCITLVMLLEMRRSVWRKTIMTEMEQRTSNSSIYLSKAANWHKKDAKSTAWVLRMLATSSHEYSWQDEHVLTDRPPYVRNHVASSVEVFTETWPLDSNKMYSAQRYSWIPSEKITPAALSTGQTTTWKKGLRW